MLDFLIIYELKKRELESAVLVGEELKRRGHSVGYFRFPGRPQFMLPGLQKRARVVVTPAAYDNQALYIMVYRYCRATRKIVNLQWEQVWTAEAESDTNHFRFPSQMARQVMHTCWGDRSRRLLLSSGLDPALARVTGPLHMDFLRPEMRSYYKSREELFQEYALDPHRFTVLFLSSFAFASYTNSELEGQKVNLSAREVDSFRDVSVSSQRATLDWIGRALDEDDTTTFIYRRHPAENDSPPLRAMMKRHANFHVISDYSVKQWILCADKIFTWYSTAIAEVYFAGRSCEVVRPVPMPPNLEVSLLETARKIEHYEDFQHSIHEDATFPIEREVMHDYYSVKGAPAYERTADLLEEVLSDDRYVVNWNPSVLAEFGARLRQDRRKSLGGAITRARIKGRRAVGRLLRRTPPPEELDALLRHSRGREKLLTEAASRDELRHLALTMRSLINRDHSARRATG